MSISPKEQIIVLLLTILLTAFSYFYLDTAIALFVFRLIRSSYLPTQTISDIPDLLPHIVVTLTVLSWTARFLLLRLGIQNRHTSFLRACGTVLPIAFVAKFIFQYVFGRSDPHALVFYHRPPQFYWFRIDEGYGCFPSGHMTVFTALMATLSQYYRRFRPIFLGLLILLALGLIATDYHFLSDVVAGVFLGMVVTLNAGDGQKFSGSPGGLTPENRPRF
jgi:membrane-associated phospholipid phosphatase